MPAERTHNPMEDAFAVSRMRESACPVRCGGSGDGVMNPKTGTQPETADTAKGVLHTTAPVPTDCSRATSLLRRRDRSRSSASTGREPRPPRDEPRIELPSALRMRKNIARTGWAREEEVPKDPKQENTVESLLPGE